MQDGKRKSIVIDAKILMFLQNEGWNRVKSQEFRTALTAALQSLQRALESRGRASMGRERRVPVGRAWAGKQESDVSWLLWTP